MKRSKAFAYGRWSVPPVLQAASLKRLDVVGRVLARVRVPPVLQAASLKHLVPGLPPHAPDGRSACIAGGLIEAR